MREATAITAPTEQITARGRRAAALRSAVGMRGRILSGTSQGGMRTATTVTASAGPAAGLWGSVMPVDVDCESVAARGRRVAVLRSLVEAPGRIPREARSVA
ncbi:hypothetical protein ACH4TV_33710 [Streptomyces sp. NPDC020898]|uniref:hypothetical protein n=1 Tax=Streptomyces sp. NPDC020898 TaxID=3365101 RepID=UPI0037B17842